jgi:hypothetical protein
MQQTLRELRKFNPDLLKELKKDLTKQAQPIFADTAARMPEVAASHWGSKGRTGYSRARAIRGLKVSVRAAKRVKGMTGSYASINLTQSNAGGAIWDQPLKENIGHTRLEVLVGSLIGPLVALPGLALVGSPLHLAGLLSRVPSPVG